MPEVLPNYSFSNGSLAIKFFFYLLILVSLHVKYGHSLTATKFEGGDLLILLLEEKNKQKNPLALYQWPLYEAGECLILVFNSKLWLFLCKIIFISKYSFSGQYYNLLFDTKFTSIQLQYICLYFRYHSISK